MPTLPPPGPWECLLQLTLPDLCELRLPCPSPPAAGDEAAMAVDTTVPDAPAIEERLIDEMQKAGIRHITIEQEDFLSPMIAQTAKLYMHGKRLSPHAYQEQKETELRMMAMYGSERLPCPLEDELRTLYRFLWPVVEKQGLSDESGGFLDHA